VAQGTCSAADLLACHAERKGVDGQAERALTASRTTKGSKIMLPDILAICSGSLVDFVLGLIGGGGSILAAAAGLCGGHSIVACRHWDKLGCGGALSSLAGHARAGNVRSSHPHKTRERGLHRAAANIMGCTARRCLSLCHRTQRHNAWRRPAVVA
jgi:hypothetical protein